MFESLFRSYPQLLLPIAEETGTSDAYRSAVLRGEPLDAQPDFRFTEKDRLETVVTPAGSVQVWYLADRLDFEHAYQALAFRCSPRPILPSVGAAAISGLINWERIRSHQSQYEAAGGNDWAGEFRRFTANKENYRDSLILLSSGPYSNVPACETGLEPESWLEKSYLIRKNHELTHFLCRRRYPDCVDTLRDEVIADGIGLLAAFGCYDPALAARFLGICPDGFLPGGRLANYFPEDPQAYIPQALAHIADFSRLGAPADPFSLLPGLYDVSCR